LISTLRKAAYKHGYLAIAAAWLFTFSFIAVNYWGYESSPSKTRDKIESRLAHSERNFLAITRDTALLSSFEDTVIRGKERLLVSEPYGIFAYTLNDVHHPILVYWNSNRFYVRNKELQLPDGNYFVKYANNNSHFEVVRRTVTFKGQTLVLVGVLPVRWEYFFHNRYLQSGFDGYPGLDAQYELSDSTGSFPVRTLEGQPLFGIRLREGKSYAGGYDTVTIILRSLAVVLLLFFLNAVAIEVTAVRGFAAGFLLLLGGIALFRLLAWKFDFPFDYGRLTLFKPYASQVGWLDHSPGDLLIDSILAFWIISFLRRYWAKILSLFSPGSQRKLAFVSLTFLVLTCFLAAGIIRNLVLDSGISFNVTDLSQLNIYSVISFVIISLVALCFFSVSHMLLRPAIDGHLELYIQVLIVLASGLIYLTAGIGHQYTVSNMGVLTWLALYLVVLHLRKQDVRLPVIASSFFVFWVMFFAVSVSLLMMHENRIVEMEQRKKFAEQLARQVDPMEDAMLQVSATNFSNKTLSDSFFKFYSEASNKQIKDSLVKRNFMGNFNQYETRIYTFDSLYHPLYNDDSVSYADVRTIILNQARPEAVPGLYSYQVGGEKPSYIYENNLPHKGSLYVITKSKKFRSEALFPELFKQSDEEFPVSNTDYMYAIYSNGKLVYRFNEYTFPSQVPREVGQQQFEIRYNGDFSELWFSGGNGKKVLVVQRDATMLELITLFAYLFCSSLLAAILFYLAESFARLRFRLGGIRKWFRFSIRSQIHTTIIFVSVFSFLVVGAATVYFFIVRFNESNRERLSKAIQIMANEIESDTRTPLVFDNTVTSNLAGSKYLERKIYEISELHNMDVNFYDMNGTLRVSTQPYIFYKRLLSDKMHPDAFYALNQNKVLPFVQQEKIGNLSYLSMYVPVTDESGNTYAYLNIPYLNSEAELDQEISGFLAALINLNAFVFLLSGAIAFLVTNRITATFGLIGEKMRQVSLGKVNEAITWKGNDEIGILVNEYNKMVMKLEQSARSLAQNEREVAWREMARQVAHEIKNPLTPMKLSIQYLQKAISNDAPNVVELTSQVSATLVEQIDQLSRIAGDFSQFANIGNVDPEELNITGIIGSLVDLYRTGTALAIEWHTEDRNYFVLADKVQMNRLFTNLLKNAVETSEGQGTRIVIHQVLQNKDVVISVSDNGNGIPERIQGRIFTPNFTTKTSGTGLGLAICKGIVEKAGGRIWFETAEGKGTTFFVSLPLLKAPSPAS